MTLKVDYCVQLYGRFSADNGQCGSLQWKKPSLETLSSIKLVDMA